MGKKKASQYYVVELLMKLNFLFSKRFFSFLITFQALKAKNLYLWLVITAVVCPVLFQSAVSASSFTGRLKQALALAALQ